MEFWGVEVKPGKSLKVLPGDEKMIHLSQASLGEYQKESGNDSIILSLKISGTNLVLGTLAAGKIPQIAFDLVFEKEFELSHNWKNGSIYFCGYRANVERDDELSDYDMSSDEELDIPIENVSNGKPEPKAAKPKAVLATSAAAKPLPKPLESKKEDDDEDSDESDDDDISELPNVSEGSDDSDDSDGDSDESDDEDMLDEDEETPKKVESANKKIRPTESAAVTPVPAKKVKLASPQKTDAKKGNVHSATPHPKKQAAKTPAPASEKLKAAATPKSTGSIGCNSCSKKFNSDKALESHTKAKHEAK